MHVDIFFISIKKSFQDILKNKERMFDQSDEELETVPDFESSGEESENEEPLKKILKIGKKRG